jgi:small nuclear ribonucleoprotein (snRNP)-like protein
VFEADLDFFLSFKPAIHPEDLPKRFSAPLLIPVPQMSSIGIPVKLLHESSGHIVTLELKTGATYRGKLLDAEDNMNIQLKDITVTARDGRVSQLDQVYIRGSQVRFFIVPDMLKVRVRGLIDVVECANVQDL